MKGFEEAYKAEVVEEKKNYRQPFLLFISDKIRLKRREFQA